MEAARWGAMPGAYVRSGPLERRPVIGGKPTWLMSRIVSDYSRPGDVVVDPYAGGGTTLIVAERLGRDSIGAEMDQSRHDTAMERLEKEQRQIGMF